MQLGAKNNSSSLLSAYEAAASMASSGALLNKTNGFRRGPDSHPSSRTCLTRHFLPKFQAGDFIIAWTLLNHHLTGAGEVARKSNYREEEERKGFLHETRRRTAVSGSLWSVVRSNGHHLSISVSCNQRQILCASLSLSCPHSLSCIHM